MARRPEPWYWAARDGWYVCLRGKQIPLARGQANKAVAWEEYHRLMVAEGSPIETPRPGRLTTRDLFNLFLIETAAAVARDDLTQVTYDGYERFLVGAAAAFGGVRAAELKPLHVNQWANGLHPRRVRRGGTAETIQAPWGPTTRHNAITAVKVAFRWARRQGLIRENPIADLAKPTPRRREAIPTGDQVEGVLDATRDREFRDLVLAIGETGCRPGEVAGVTAAMVDLDAGTWTVPNKTRRRTGEPTRTVYLTPVMVELSRRLVEARPDDGPIFRNTRGNPWTRHAVACRFGELKRKLGMGPEAAANALRHLYITDALERGVPIPELAELVGHRDATMILRVYSKLSERREHLKAAARRARPESD